MQEYRAAAAGNARGAVVIDFDDEIIEVVVALQPVAAAGRLAPYRLVVMAACGIFAPGIFRPDRANGQECPRPRMAVGPPPQSAWPERAFWGAAVALVLVGPNSAAPQRDGDRLSARNQPAPARIARACANSDCGQWPISRTCLISI